MPRIAATRCARDMHPSYRPHARWKRARSAITSADRTRPPRWPASTGRVARSFLMSQPKQWGPRAVPAEAPTAFIDGAAHTCVIAGTRSAPADGRVSHGPTSAPTTRAHPSWSCCRYDTGRGKRALMVRTPAATGASSEENVCEQVKPDDRDRHLSGPSSSGRAGSRRAVPRRAAPNPPAAARAASAFHRTRY